MFLFVHNSCMVFVVPYSYLVNADPESINFITLKYRNVSRKYLGFIEQSFDFIERFVIVEWIVKSDNLILTRRSAPVNKQAQKSDPGVIRSRLCVSIVQPRISSCAAGGSPTGSSINDDGERGMLDSGRPLRLIKREIAAAECPYILPISSVV